MTRLSAGNKSKIISKRQNEEFEFWLYFAIINSSTPPSMICLLVSFQSVMGWPLSFTLFTWMRPGVLFLAVMTKSLPFSRCKVAFLNKPLAYYNQDVDVANRGTNHLYEPQAHLLWNLSFLEPVEPTDADYKRLVDRLRTDGLMSYLLDRRYTESARQELAKVDWKLQPAKVRRLYQKPLWLLRTRRFFLRLGYNIKKMIFRYK